MRPLFEYPTNTGYPIRLNEHISWRTVYNLYLKNKKKFATDLGDAMADEAVGVNELMEE